MSMEKDKILPPPTAEHMIDTMKAAQEPGARIFYRERQPGGRDHDSDEGWVPTVAPAWNWGWVDYKVIPAPLAILLMRRKHSVNWQQWAFGVGSDERMTAIILTKAWEERVASKPELAEEFITRIIEIED